MGKQLTHEVSRSTLERFAGGGASEREKLLVLRHLVAGCGPCQRALRLVGWHSEREEMRLTLGNVVPAGPPPGSYDGALTAAKLKTLSAFDRRHAPVKDLLAELDSMAPEEREFKVRNLRRYFVGQLALALVDRSFELRYSDPARVLHYARLAVAVAEVARPETSGGRSLLTDCRARALAQLGNAHRICGQLAAAESCFATSSRYVQEGSGDPEVRAWVVRLLASLRTTQRAFEEAVSLNAEAALVYRRLGDRLGEATTLIGLAWAKIAAGDPEPAIPPLQRSIEILDPWHDWEQKLIRAASINLVLCYIDVDRPQDAYNTVALAEPYFEDCPDTLNRERWNWQRGKVDRERRDFFSAEVRLMRVRDALADAKVDEQVGEVLLDLAILYARQGRRADYLRAVGEAASIFQSVGAKREFLAAMGQLTRMAQRREAAVHQLRHLVVQCRGGVPRAERS